MGEAAGAEHLVCRDNHFARLGLRLVEGNEGFAAIQLLGVKQAELRGNQISAVALKAKGLLAIDAVRVLAVPDLQVAGNSFTDIGPPEGRATSICLRVVTPFERVAIECNRMMQVLEGKVANDPPKWGGILIGADLVSSIRYLSPAHVIQDPKQFLGLPAGSGILLSGKQILFVKRGNLDVSLQGNHLEAVASVIPLLQVQGIGHGRLAGNVLRRSELADNWLADLIAESLSVSDNLFTTPRSDSATLKVSLPPERPAVVTGNTSTGKFNIVNQAVLPADITLTNLFQS
jgi:hypothetical protein